MKTGSLLGPYSARWVQVFSSVKGEFYENCSHLKKNLFSHMPIMLRCYETRILSTSKGQFLEIHNGKSLSFSSESD
jgi:hypothetical protein